MIDLTTTDRQFLRVDEVMGLFGVSRRTVYYWAHHRKLACIHIDRTLRFPIADLRRLIVRAARTPPKPTDPVKVLRTRAQTSTLGA
jgi:predicted DNA-binding transcriptional regulator AlpA